MNPAPKDLRPTLWRSCRTLASKRRLRMLRELFWQSPQCVEDIADKLHLPSNTATQYLRMLNARGLLSARRQSRYVWYTPKANPSVDGSEKLLDSLRKALNTDDSSIDYVYAQVTAFTHERRVLIMQMLAENACTSFHLCRNLNMPSSSLLRHVHKLVRRGYVTYDAKAKAYTALPQNEPLAKTLLDLACAHK